MQPSVRTVAPTSMPPAASSPPANRSPSDSTAGAQDGQIGIDGHAATRVDLEVEVRDADGVARVAHVADHLTLRNPTGPTLVGGEVGVVVAVAVVAEQPDDGAAQHVRALLDEAGHD